MRALACCLALLPTYLLAEDVPLVTDITSVTLYPQGATITREAPFDVPFGQNHLIITDLPLSTPLASVRVEVAGALMGSISTRRNFVPPRSGETDAAIAAAEAEVERLERALRDAEGAVRKIWIEAEAAQARVAFLQDLGKGEGVAALDPAALRDLIALVGSETMAALQAALVADRRATEAELGLKDLREELETARKAVQALVPEDKERAMLAVAVDTGDASSEGSIVVTYTIPNAGWQPVYDLRLARDTGVLGIDRGAMVWQDTGENWQDVALTLSTVRPSEQTAPSDIWPWLRRIYDPEDVRVKTLMREEMELGAMSGAMMDAPVMAEPVMVTEAAANFDGLAVTYSYPDAVSVATGADSLRLALGTLETSADMVARAVPLNDQTAFLMARVTNDTGELILPTSEASFFLDGRFVGQRYLELIPAGGKADLSFGPIDGLRLTRTVLDRNEGDRGVISKSNALTEGVEIEIENLTGETWPVRLLDRVPYSEQEDLEIDWQASRQPVEDSVDGKRGVLAWEFDIAPRATETIRLNHALEWPEGMALQ